MIDLEKMAKKHEKLFPNATAESQVWKLEEEIKEYGETQTEEEEIKELADIWIVCCGLYRWFPYAVAFIVSSCSILYAGYDMKKIEQEVERKWQINLNRKWEWNGKTYQHIDK